MLLEKHLSRTSCYRGERLWLPFTQDPKVFFVLLKKNSPITSGHKASPCYKETDPLLLINIIYYLFKNSFLHLYMLADRVNAGNLQTKGTAGKLGEATRERKEAQPQLVPLTSATQQGDEWECWEALRSHWGSLEKALHRRYSKTEFYNKGRRFPHLRSQGRVVLLK